MVVDGDTADVRAFVVECKAEFLAGDFKDVESDLHDFGPDAITGENCEFKRLH